MKDPHIGVGIGEHGGSIVIAPFNAQRRCAHPAEFPLTRFVRMGAPETCGMLGTIMLTILPIYHRALFTGRTLIDAQRNFGSDQAEAIDPAVHNGSTSGPTLAVGIADDWQAIIIEARSATGADGTYQTLGQSLRTFSALEAAGPQYAPREVGELTLGMLAILHPEAFRWLGLGAPE